MSSSKEFDVLHRVREVHERGVRVRDTGGVHCGSVSAMKQGRIYEGTYC